MSSTGENQPLLRSRDANQATWRASTRELPQYPGTHSQGHNHDDETEPSLGVAQMTAASSQLTTASRLWLFFGIFVVGYAYGLESQVRSAYQPYATSSFSLHSYTSTINVLRSVIAVAAQPTAAKVADVFGRFEVIAVSTILYTAGIAIEATASSVEVFCTGSVIYQAGYTCIVLLMEVLIADFSSMKARVFMSYIPAIPFIINTWISGNITDAVLKNTSWRWGIGMWAIIYPICSLPLMTSLYAIKRRSEKASISSALRYYLEDRGYQSWMTELFDQLDVVGLFTLVGSFCLVLAPLTIAGGHGSHWKDPKIVAPLILGLILFPIFVYWEKCRARKPLVPFELLRDRGVWAALAVRTLLNFAWATQGNYLYTILVVAFDFSVVTSTRILSFFSFFGVFSGVVIGLVIYKLRRLKWIIVAGTCVFMGAFAILIAHPGGASVDSKHGMLAAQIILGLAGGLFAYPTQASIQAAAKREHVAILTGLYLSCFNLGGALGTCLAGAIWTQTLYKTLETNLAFQPNTTLAQQIYDHPFDIIGDYPVGTEIRSAIIDSYSHVQRLLAISGLVICIPMIGFALALRNPHLSEGETQSEEEEPLRS